MESSNREYLVGVDYLRGLSAFWVVGHHILDLLPPSVENRNSSHNPVVIFFNAGWIGVSVFIILSGYSLSLGTKDKAIIWKNFAISRFLRLSPMYYLISILSLLYGTIGLIPFLGSLIFLPVSDAAIYRPLMWTVWSVRIEVLTYLFFPILWSLSRNRRDISRWLSLTIFLIFLFQLSTGSTALTLYWGLPGRLLEFSFGFYIGRVGIRKSSKSSFLISMICLFILSPIVIQKLGGFSSLGALSWYLIFSANSFFVCCILMNIRLWKDLKLLRFLQQSRRYSYSVYLVHVSIIVIFGRRILSTFTSVMTYGQAFLFTSLIIFILVFLISYTLFELIEYPFLKRRPKYLV